MGDEKWRKLIKTLSKFRLPKIRSCTLNKVPENWEDIFSFMKHSLVSLTYFYIYNENKVDLDNEKLVEALKQVAQKTTDFFSAAYIKFSTKEFCELISSAKHIEQIDLIYDSIPLDEECDFGQDMENCKLEVLNLNQSGSNENGNWETSNRSFKNLVAGISKCLPLKNSLKIIHLYNWGVTKEKTQEYLDECNLNNITLGSI